MASENLEPWQMTVDIDRRPLSPRQTELMTRLGSWKSPSPTKENIENRLNEANMKRNDLMASKTSAIKSRQEKASTNISTLRNLESTALADKSASIAQKLEKATDKYEEQMKHKVDKVAGHNSKIEKVKTEVFDSTTKRSEELASAIDQKLSIATDNYSERMASKVSKVAGHNSKISKAKADVFEETTKKSEELANAIDQKLVLAATKHEQNVASVIMKTSTHNDEVKRAHVRVLSSNDSKASSLEATTAAKLQSAAEARQSLITSKVMSVGQQTRDKQERGKQALASKADRSAKIQNDLESKISAAAANKTAILQEKAAKSSAKKRSPRGDTSPARKSEDIAVRLDSAAARRETLLMQRSEACGHRNERVREVSDLARTGECQLPAPAASSPHPHGHAMRLRSKG